MLDVNDFEAVFSFDPNYTYSQTTITSINSNRRTLGGTLFFDKLLAQLHIKSGHLYPPHKNADLRDLHERIVTAPIADHHKQSVLFYILRDCRAPDAALDPADSFAKSCYLPQKYWVVVEGLWEMDHLQFRPAMESLTHPSLLPTFPAEVLLTLLEHVQESDRDLPLAYYNCVQPPLTTPALQTSYFRYLAGLSVTEAYAFLQAQPSQTQKNLLQILISETLSFVPLSERAERSVELIDLPFTDEEEEWFEDYLLAGKGRTLHGARDTVVMRRIAVGKYADALDVGKQLTGRRYDGVTWESIKDKIGRGLGPRADLNVFNMP
ncbi:uncharacterized protein K452DRAFT_245384 [Aplosporella prunicola CBS 121167]|uniref:ELYS-like domain-containing protein n=1 Tax=Aplosporella prunicola CBS 121167 TaxID=1176127 RepID=A0A6A6BMK3_9PEZI|nr:uncharacterized protein K452DRAFT_245384 [Aplosporella prunicola CBS 121167]KAF2144504.1 hypothetical protein K452DRAFT_245384 [Aplosporella prunicola CBS 121167]